MEKTYFSFIDVSGQPAGVVDMRGIHHVTVHNNDTICADISIKYSNNDHPIYLGRLSYETINEFIDAIKGFNDGIEYNHEKEEINDEKDE